MLNTSSYLKISTNLWAWYTLVMHFISNTHTTHTAQHSTSLTVCSTEGYDLGYSTERWASHKPLSLLTTH